VSGVPVVGREAGDVEGGEARRPDLDDPIPPPVGAA